jgi:hypothetical protein
MAQASVAVVSQDKPNPSRRGRLGSWGWPPTAPEILRLRTQEERALLVDRRCPDCLRRSESCTAGVDLEEAVEVSLAAAHVRCYAPLNLVSLTLTRILYERASMKSRVIVPRASDLHVFLCQPHL